MFKQNQRALLGATVLLLLAVQAYSSDLMCYICDDCAKLDANTPMLACNEDFFNQGGTTEASTGTSTTTESTTESSGSTEAETSSMPTTQSSSSSTEMETSSSTTIEPSTTLGIDPTTTTMDTTLMPVSTETTEEPVPKPPTVGPVETTTGVPTPPNEDFLRETNVTQLTQLVNSNNSFVVPTEPTLLVRQRRALINTDISYHCYSVQKNINGSMTTERGCSRVSTEQGVCPQLQLENNATELINCNPCSMNQCNGANALHISFVTLLLAGVASWLQRN